MSPVSGTAKGTSCTNGPIMLTDALVRWPSAIETLGILLPYRYSTADNVARRYSNFVTAVQAAAARRSALSPGPSRNSVDSVAWLPSVIPDAPREA